MTTKTLHNDVNTAINSADDSDAEHTATDIFDPQHLRLSQNFATTIGVKKRVTLIQVRKPAKQEFIRVHPSKDYYVDTAILEF